MKEHQPLYVPSPKVSLGSFSVPPSFERQRITNFFRKTTVNQYESFVDEYFLDLSSFENVFLHLHQPKNRREVYKLEPFWDSIAPGFWSILQHPMNFESFNSTNTQNKFTQKKGRVEMFHRSINHTVLLLYSDDDCETFYRPNFDLYDPSIILSRDAHIQCTFGGAR